MKKGFTLIELIAVILILAIIALIAIPKINNVIEESKKSSFEVSVKEILRAAQIYAAKKEMRGSVDYPIVFTCDGKKCVNGDEVLKFKGEVPTSGKITINGQQEIEATRLTDGEWFATGDTKNIEISKDYVSLLNPGAYDKDYNLVVDWNTLETTYEYDITTVFAYSQTGDTSYKTLTNVIKNNPELDSIRVLIIPNGVSSIGDYSFYNSKLTEVVIPESCIKIGVNSFRKTNLVKLTFKNPNGWQFKQNGGNNNTWTDVDFPDPETNATVVTGNSNGTYQRNN